MYVRSLEKDMEINRIKKMGYRAGQPIPMNTPGKTTSVLIYTFLIVYERPVNKFATHLQASFMK